MMSFGHVGGHEVRGRTVVPKRNAARLPTEPARERGVGLVLAPQFSTYSIAAYKRDPHRQRGCDRRSNRRGGRRSRECRSKHRRLLCARIAGRDNRADRRGCGETQEGAAV